MSLLVADKLFESAQGANAARKPSRLKKRKGPPFPDVRAIVNEGVVSLGEIIEWRKKGATFRRWLQSESELNREAALSYYNEFRQTDWLPTRAQEKWPTCLR